MRYNTIYVTAEGKEVRIHYTVISFVRSGVVQEIRIYEIQHDLWNE